MTLQSIQRICAELLVLDSNERDVLSSLRKQLEGVREEAIEIVPACLNVFDQVLDCLERIVSEEASDPAGELRRATQALDCVREACESMVPESEGSDEDESGFSEIEADFLAGQPSNLDEIEELAMDEEREPDEAQRREIRGRIHTLKGESGLLGYNDVSAACHQLEELLLANEESLDSKLVLNFVDWLRERFQGQMRGETEFAPPPSISKSANEEADVVETAPVGESEAEGQAPEEKNADVEEDEPEASEPASEIEKPATAVRAVAADAASVADVPAPKATAEGPFADFDPDFKFNVEHPPEILAPQEVTQEAELVADFVAEARDHLEEVDSQLLALDRDNANQEALNSVFRSFHTIKGVASFLDLPVITHLAHMAENMFDLARQGALAMPGLPMAAAFEAADALKGLVEDVEKTLSDGRPAPARPEVVTAFDRFALILAQVPSDATSTFDAPDLGTAAVETSEEILHDVDAPAAAEGTPTVATETREEEPEKPVALEEERAVEDNSAQESEERTESPIKKQESKSAEAPAATKEPAPAKESKPAKGGAGQRGKAVAVRENIKVDAARLDALVDMIGELVIAETMVSQSDELDTSGMTRLPGLVSHMNKITRELQELAMSLRMVPIRPTFRRMERLARDVSTKTGKPIVFTTHGEDTELDKTVVDAIGDPLIHMIRNAVDHGIEPDQDARMAAGKPAMGRIQLRAFHRGGSIHVEIEDDGRGLDPEKILSKARERGIVSEEEKLTDHEIYNLIFAPGFSTAATVTDVSGRGVGMDVVRRNIEAMRGRTEIRSTLGKGCVFSIRLPLTLAIIDGMVVRVSGERFVLPTISIVRMLRPDEISVNSVLGKGKLMRVGDELIPLLRLDDVFEVEMSQSDRSRESVVIVEHEGRQWGLIVDRILGQQQIVIKPLGPAFGSASGLAGGAIMPDGQVGLIVDIAGIVRLIGGEAVKAERAEAMRERSESERN